MQFSNLEFNKLFDGVQAVIGFGKTYELSIIKHSSSYGGKQGLYEIAVFKDGDQAELPGITEDGDTIKGFLNESDVDAIIKKMQLVSGEDGVQV